MCCVHHHEHTVIAEGSRGIVLKGYGSIDIYPEIDMS